MPAAPLLAARPARPAPLLVAVADVCVRNGDENPERGR